MTAAENTIVQTHTDNLETFSLVWLDEKVNKKEENKRAQKRLRSIINHLKTFDDQNECQQYIMSRSEQDRVVLIISGQLSKDLIPRIHDLRQLSAIYIYCWNRKAYKPWAKNFTKINGVLVQLDDLINQITLDQKERGKQEEPMVMSFYNVSSNADKSTTQLNGHFIHSLLLIDVLIRMKPNDADKKKLIEICKEEFDDNEPQLAIVHEFERKYRSKKAIWWYTRDAFLYRMLNKALRVQNIELLLLFRFVVRDIYEQLKKHQCRNPICVYRYQAMSVDELNNLQRSIGQFISVNSFFSTSADRDVAVKFLRSTPISNDLHRVLFIIDADPRVVKSKPFADISSLSYFTHESEILFMVGCIFRLTNIYRDENEKIWTIQMQLAEDNDNNLKKLFEQLKSDYGGDEDEADLKSFGDVLQHMGKYDLAEKIYIDLRKKCTPDDSSYSQLCFSFGMLYKERKDFDRSLQWFQRALDRKLRTEPTDLVYIGGLHCCIGNIHMEKNDFNEAMKCYTTAMGCYNRANAKNHPYMASLYHGVARVCCARKQYSDALNYYTHSLNIQQQYLPSNHPDTALNHVGIGDIYRIVGQYQNAMNYYRMALDIRIKSLPPQHQDIGSSNKNIGLLYETMNSFKEALGYYQKAYTMYRHSLPPENPNVVEIEKDIERVIAKLK
ncbi:unnamed protein product [Rotaria sp. Silwood2]|nr:unnamed protein product [Rotaria sp. Silwood2]CAF2659962.1 unnamed protein product [Rotaria sp. Silwood2]CAF2895181.1 unnamed protein product [Rotaria sp. Silwood2]CAF3077864.1 unnamed protein product [Rotaria sp. Silwood2]CAF4449711.1 unnamed protein product [Rotaria sp. Silwood2]